MPVLNQFYRPHNIATVFFDIMIVVTVLTVMGHFGTNFWERYVIRSELVKMKSSLCSLKETVNNIGAAYDCLQKELEGIADFTEKDRSMIVYDTSFATKCTNTIDNKQDQSAQTDPLSPQQSKVEIIKKNRITECPVDFFQDSTSSDEFEYSETGSIEDKLDDEEKTVRVINTTRKNSVYSSTSNVPSVYGNIIDVVEDKTDSVITKQKEYKVKQVNNKEDKSNFMKCKSINTVNENELKTDAAVVKKSKKAVGTEALSKSKWRTSLERKLGRISKGQRKFSKNDKNVHYCYKDISSYGNPFNFRF